MASNPIETAPKNEEWIALLGESGDVFEIGRWSVQRGSWVGRDGEPIRLKPTQWFEPDPAWLSAAYTDIHTPERKKAPRRRRLGLYAVVAILAWSALLEFLRFVEPPSREDLEKFFSTGASAVLEVLRFAEPPIRETFEKIFSAGASFEPETMASQPVAGTDMATLYVRTAPESEAVIENSSAQASAKASSTPQAHSRADVPPADLVPAREPLEAVTPHATHTTPAGDAAAHEHDQLRQSRRIDALAREVAALREELEAMKSRFVAPNAASVGRARDAEGQSATIASQEPDLTALRDETGAAVPPVAAIEKEPIAPSAKSGAHFDAQAALMLAATYDADALERVGDSGRAPGDFAKAPSWYETAMLAALPNRRPSSKLWPLGTWPRADVPNVGATVLHR